MADERFRHVTMEMRDIGKCYRILIYANGETISHVNTTVRWNMNEIEIIQDKVDLIIEAFEGTNRARKR